MWSVIALIEYQGTYTVSLEVKRTIDESKYDEDDGDTPSSREELKKKRKKVDGVHVPLVTTNDPDIITDNNLVTIGCFVVVRPKQADEGRFWIGQV